MLRDAQTNGYKLLRMFYSFNMDTELFANWRTSLTIIIIHPASLPLTVPTPLWQPIHPLLQPFLCHVFVLHPELCPLGPGTRSSSAC